METIFNETMIRAELKRLDQKTGFNGASLPIKFGNAKYTLGRFSYSNENALGFYFSNHYFLDPMFPVEEKIDTIRHEYAHYMDYMLNGTSSHGPQWKKCAKTVGACPTRLFSEDRANYFLKKHQEERETNIKCDEYVIGDIINHPDFGRGIIEDVLGEGISRIVNIHFNNGTCKKLSLKWVTEKCR